MIAKVAIRTMGKKNKNRRRRAPGSESESPKNFIDHRGHDDLAHFHLSPARFRRRQLLNPNMESSPLERSSMPLTNQNLQLLGERTRLAESPGTAYGSVALNMDQYAEEQRRLLQNWASMNDDYHPEEDDNNSLNTFEFGGSNPLSDHLSDLTSLDDVCFPDYYEVTDDKSTAWPDLEVLQEFVDAEQKRIQEPEVNFQHPIASSVTLHSDLLLNRQVTEVELLSSKEGLRVRPTPIQPWESQKDIPTILRHGHSQLLVPQAKGFDGVCRFTYFREDLEKTIHSPTISGLLANNKAEETNVTSLSKKWGKPESKPEQPNMNDGDLTLPDLFSPPHYSQRGLSAAVSLRAPTPALDKRNGLTMEDADKSPLTPENRSHNASTNNLKQFGKLTFETSTTPVTQGSVREDRPHATNPFWLDVLNPTEEEMKVLSRAFGIHPLTTEDIFLGEAREKVELFKLYYFICFTSFDIVYERRKQRAREKEKKVSKLQEMYDNIDDRDNNIFGLPEQRLWIRSLFSKNERLKLMSHHSRSSTTSRRSNSKKIREGELLPLNMYMIVFRDAVITFHFSATPHPINVRRRARLLKEYLNVSSDWICYAMIDDITDSFAPMIDSIEEEVNSIEDAILRMHAGEDSDEEEDSESEDGSHDHAVFYRRKRLKSTVEYTRPGFFGSTKSSHSTKSSSRLSRILGWKRKGDMLRRIGECRKRVMSVLRLLGSKADVIKGFSKRLSELDVPLATRSVTGFSQKNDIGMYLGDIQDHIITMIQSLNHYEKLLARFHSNYLAQINIDMTKVNNDTNDVLGKITILGTIVLPINVVTGLWGMNCIVPGQDYEGLAWFWLIIGGMVLFSIFAYNYAKRVTGL